jgi:hypothetical protein
MEIVSNPVSAMYTKSWSLHAKMDLLMKKLEASSNMDTAKIMDARMT